MSYPVKHQQDDDERTGATLMEQRTLGQLAVSPIGYGAMVLEGYYGGVGEAEAVKTIQYALDHGINFIDTADAYGRL
jgi:aryl-alcohol dehydrogenase-like predicted oxidoreductase